MATKKSKRPTRRAKTLKAKKLTAKHSKGVKGGASTMQMTQTYLSTLNQASQLTSNLGQKMSDLTASIRKNWSG